ncbi:PLP-dependent lyase/thiolase [Candidatus Woesearchaeota archaeon]|nr:PLP-dependent lyase/thiolase [Candidatus Woesearchaeota archaeon]
MTTALQEKDFPQYMTRELVEQWGDSIPCFSENDPSAPEWTPTPVIPADLTPFGYGQVLIKNEAVPSNPTHTIKDRSAWEIAALYRDFARLLYMRTKTGNDSKLDAIPVPRFSVLTAGNAGRALAHVFHRYGLPPIKLLIDENISAERLGSLKQLWADIYCVDLKAQSLTPFDIKALTNNSQGIDLTSVMTLEPHAVFYDWHVHEAFNESPDEIYVPYGSGRLFENYLTWQERTLRAASQGQRDPRLQVSATTVITMDILGAEPLLPTSRADKLTKPWHPFLILEKDDMSALQVLGATGSNTGVYGVLEEKIRDADTIMNRFCPAEPSAAAGLALYMQRCDAGRVDPHKKVLIINTGKGI